MIPARAERKVSTAMIEHSTRHRRRSPDSARSPRQPQPGPRLSWIRHALGGGSINESSNTTTGSVQKSRFYRVQLEPPKPTGQSARPRNSSGAVRCYLLTRHGLMIVSVLLSGSGTVCWHGFGLMQLSEQRIREEPVTGNKLINTAAILFVVKFPKI